MITESTMNESDQECCGKIDLFVPGRLCILGKSEALQDIEYI